MIGILCRKIFDKLGSGICFNPNLGANSKWVPILSKDFFNLNVHTFKYILKEYLWTFDMTCPEKISISKLQIQRWGNWTEKKRKRYEDFDSRDNKWFRIKTKSKDIVLWKDIIYKSLCYLFHVLSNSKIALQRTFSI